LRRRLRMSWPGVAGDATTKPSPCSVTTELEAHDSNYSCRTSLPPIEAIWNAGPSITTEKPSPAVESVPGPPPRTDGREMPPDEGSVVSLDELAPSPSSPIPSTAMVRARTQPADGVRERQGDIAVVSRCEAQTCLDGLRDLRTERELIPFAPTRDEKETLDGQGSVQRVVKLARASDDSVSVYLGSTSTSEGSKSTNRLACVTYNRHTGRPMSLKHAVDPKQVPALMLRAGKKLEAFQQERGLPAYRLSQDGFLRDTSSGRIAFCAEAPSPMAGTVIVIWLET
jgi:hypothetical protein